MQWQAMPKTGTQMISRVHTNLETIAPLREKTLSKVMKTKLA